MAETVTGLHRAIDLEPDPGATQERMRIEDRPRTDDVHRRSPHWTPGAARGWLMAAAVIVGGGGAGVGASSFLAPNDEAISELRRDVDANLRSIEAANIAQAKADKHQAETELRIMSDNATTQLWIAEILIDFAEAMDRVGAKVGVDAHVRVPPLVRGPK